MTLCGGNIKLDANLRPHRIDYSRMMTKLSKTLMSMPLIESLDLTIEDCVIREHNEYLKLLQPRNDEGVPLQPPSQLLQMMEKSMLIVGDGVCVRREGQRKHSTRAAYENLEKISKEMQDARQQHKGRLPRPNMIIEVKKVEEVNQAFSCAPLGLAFLRLYTRAEMKMRVGTNARAAQTEQAIGSQSLKKFVEAKNIRKFDTVKKFASEFGIGWTPEYHEEVTKLKESEQVELYELLERVTVAQILALYATFGMKSFMFGPATLLQEYWKKQSLQQTLCLAILTLGRMHELLEVVDFFDALMPEKVPGADRKGVLYYKSQLIELQTIIHASDTIMAHDGDGLTP